MENTQASSFASASKGGIILAAVLAVLSVAAITLPIVNVQIMGFSGGLPLASPHFLGAVAYFVSLVFVAGLVMRFAPQTHPYIRAVEIAGLAITVAIVLYAVMTLINGMNEMSNANRQMSQLLGSNVQPFSRPGMVALASGAFALALLLLGSTWQVWSSRKR